MRERSAARVYPETDRHYARHYEGVCAMVETRTLEDSRRDERLLVDRLIKRQGLSRDEAVRTVGDYREGKRVEIDPILMEGLDAI
ncbi:MAG TPA: hypothetical protein PK080_00540 [Hyphomonadaceae bacterium]|nr:hypothetical protein [Hyphomonadaceae bacterium]